MTEALAQLSNLREEIEAKHKEMKTAAQEAIKEGTKAIFEEYGDILEKFGWTQYTPYFNDGEPCEFNVHELCLVEKNADSDEEEDGWPYESSSAFYGYGNESKVTPRWGKKDNSNVDPRYDACLTACEQVFEALSFGDLAKDIFGDHAIVTFTSDGVDVDEYSHD